MPIGPACEEEINLRVKIQYRREKLYPEVIEIFHCHFNLTGVIREDISDMTTTKFIQCPTRKAKNLEKASRYIRVNPFILTHLPIDQALISNTDPHRKQYDPMIELKNSHAL